MATVTIAVLETSGEKASGTVRFKIENGICIREAESKREYFEQSKGVEAKVSTIEDGDRLIREFLKLAGVPAESKKRPKD